MPKVALIRCESYEYGNVRGAVVRGLDLIGGVSTATENDGQII